MYEKLGLTEEQKEQPPQDLPIPPKSKPLTRDEQKKVDAVRVKKLRAKISYRVQH